MQIGEVAARVGLSLRTIRHYDEIGLVTPSERSPGGFRLYTEQDVERLTLVKSMKPLEFPLEQIRDLVELITALSTEPPPDAETADDLLKRLGMYRAAADSRIEALRAQLHGLEALSQNLRSLATTTARRTGSPRRR
jgi:DNA-binding transcriptional MerR regulator